MAKVPTPGGMKPIQLNRPQCQEPFEADVTNPPAHCPKCRQAYAGAGVQPPTAVDAFQVESPGLDALMAAKERAVFGS